VVGRVNGVVRQQSRTDQLIFDAGYLVWFVSRVMTLLPGDIISTGTPAGTGRLPATWSRSRWRGWAS
jgi:2-keto-4-pentenoate hydratase/2-oxohepta-3-ene-1,7-dioic acid hydratase in catechol pathway